jgi:hypothetical protein
MVLHDVAGESSQGPMAILDSDEDDNEDNI